MFENPHLPTSCINIFKTEEKVEAAPALEFTMDSVPDYEEEEIHIEIHRQPGQGLGISIAGGKGSIPYRGDDESIFISRVSEDGPAGKAGVLVGDKLISMNEANLEGADHYDAVDVLKTAGNDITMILGREKPRENPNEIIKEISNMEDANRDTCSICLDDFRCPKLLPCRHTFCKRCIRYHELRNAMEESLFLCPVCRAALRVPDSGVNGFCDNYFVSKLRPDSICDDCSAEEEVIECPKCEKYLCTTCNPGHRCVSTFPSRWSLYESDTNSISSDISDEYDHTFRDIGCKTLYKAVQVLEIDPDMEGPPVYKIMPLSSEMMGIVFFSIPYLYRYQLDGRNLPFQELIDDFHDVACGPQEEIFSVFGNDTVVKMEEGFSCVFSVTGCIPLKIVSLRNGQIVIIGKPNIGNLMIVHLDGKCKEISRSLTTLNFCPYSVAASLSPNRVCVISENSRCVYVLDFEGNIKNVHDISKFPEDTLGENFQFSSVCCDTDGNFLIIEAESKWVHMLSSDGKLTGLIGSDSFQCPCSIAVDSDGRIWIGDSEDSKIRIFTVDSYINVFLHPNNIRRLQELHPLSSLL